MNNKEKTIKYLENVKKRAEKMATIYYCQVCKKPTVKQILASDGTIPFEDIVPNIMTGFREFICIGCYKNE